METYAYSHPHCVQNVYGFDFRPSSNSSSGGQPEVFLGVMGNPWMDLPVPVHGLVIMDLEVGIFAKITTCAALNIQLAKQPSPCVFYALPQELESFQSRIMRLEARTNEVLGRANWS